MKNLLFVFLTFLMFVNVGFAQSDNIIEQDLQVLLNQKSDEMIEINIVFKSQIASKELKTKTRNRDKSQQREVVVSELKDFSQKHQAEVMSILRAEELNAKVSDINCLWITNSISCKASRDVIYTLSSHPDILSIGYDREIKMIEDKEIEIKDAPAVRGSATPHIIQINADDVWSQGYTGKNVVVAVLDSGINIDHYDLKDHLWTGYADTDGDGFADDVIHGWNYVSDNSEINDDFGHGTHCAGVVCGDGTIGNTTGVAPDATLMTLKIVNRAGGGSVTNMIKGVQFAVENGAQILSISLGYKIEQIGLAAKESLRQTFVSALDAGVIVCAAAGNDGATSGSLNNIDIPGACPPPWLHEDQKVINEGGLSSVVCVGSVNSYNEHVTTSSEGPVTWQDVASYNDYPYDGTNTFGLIRPDISAPGELVYSLKYDENDKYKYMSGTSQATPCVAGVMALMLEKNSSLTPAQICEIIETTASNKPTAKNNYVGSGVVDALAAVNACDAANEKAFIKISRYTPKTIINKNNIEVKITVSNQGKGTCENAVSTLSTNDPYITIQEASQNVGNISTNTEKVLSYVIDAVNAPNGHMSILSLTTTDGSISWSDDIILTIDSYEKIVYQSSSPGIIEAGKNTDFNVTVINKGTVATEYDSDVRLSTNSSFVTIVDDVKTIETIGAGEEKTITYSVYVDPVIPDNAIVNFELQSTPNNFQNVKDIMYEFEKGFDDYGYLDDGLDGWTTFDANDDGRDHPWWHSSEYGIHKVENAGDAHSGTGQLMSETYCQASLIEYAKPIDNYLVSPRIKATDNSKFSFYARVHDKFYGERFGVAVSENSNNTASDFITISNYQIIRSHGNDWILYTVDLSSYAGKEIYVAIRHYFTEKQWELVDNGMDTYILHVDDVMFSDVVECSDEFMIDNKSYFSVSIKSNPLPAPENIIATPNGTTAISLSWLEVGGAQSYNIYRNGYYVKNIATGTSFDDTDLKPNTEYCYEIASVYNNREYEHSEAVCVKTNRLEFSTNIKEISTDKVYPGNNTVSVTLVNDGLKEHGSKTTVSMTTTDQYVNATSITPATGKVMSALAVDGEQTIDFTFTLNDNTPHNHVVGFNIHVEGSKVYDGTSWDNNREWDIPFEVKVVNDLETPYDVIANISNENSVKLTWSQSYLAESYNIYRDGDLIANVADNNYIDSDLYHNTEYSYSITSVRGTNESAHSEVISVTMPQLARYIVCESIDNTELIVGRETEVIVNLINEGFADVENVTAVLSCNNDAISIIENNILIPEIKAGETEKVSFKLTTTDAISDNENIEFDVVANYYNETISNLKYTFNNDIEGWSVYERDSDGNNWEYNAGNVISYSYKNKNLTPDNLLISPQKITATDETTIKYQVGSTYTGSSGYYKEKYRIFVTELGPDVDYGWAWVKDQTEVKQETLPSKGWQTREVSLSSQAGKSIWIVFEHYDCIGQDAIVIDDIEITNVMTSANVSNTSSFTMKAVAATNNFIVDGLWNDPDNWSEARVPIATDNVVVEAAAIINSDIVINSINVSRSANASLTIDSNASLTVVELINSNAEALIIKDGAQLFHNSDNVKASFTMGIVNPEGEWNENNKTGWQFIASPFTDADVSAFIPDEDRYELYKYDGGKDYEWINHKGENFEETSFVSGRAYLASYETLEKATFSGTFNNAKSHSWDLSYNAEKPLANFHLVGNPFTFDMDIAKATFTNLANGVAVVTPAGGYDYSQTTIPVGDGFFVKATGENPSLSYNHNASVTRRGSESNNSLNITATGNAGKDNVVINFAGKSEGFDKLQNFNDAIATVYVAEDGKNYGIYNCDADVQEVALSFNANKMGNYTISIEPNGKFQTVTLVDRFTGVETNMLVEDYNFTAMSSDNHNRFVVRFANGQESTDDSHFVYQSGEELILNIQGDVQIVDVLGRVVYNGEAMNDINRINVSSFNSGAYMVRVMNGNDVKVEKVVIY